MTNTADPRSCQSCGRPSRRRPRCGACRRRQRQHVDRYAEREPQQHDLDVMRRRLRQHFGARGGEP